MAVQRAPKRVGQGDIANANGTGLVDHLIQRLVRTEIAGELADVWDGLRSLRSDVEGIDVERWPRMMFRAEAARYLGISSWMLDALVRQGHINPEHRAGIESRVYLIEELDRYRLDKQST